MNKSTESNKPFKLIGIKEQRDSQAEGRPAKSFQEYPGLTPANEELETASDNVSQDENKEEIQEVTEININEFHESRRPLLHLSVDIDTDGHYNKEDTSNVTQVAEKTKKSKKGFKVKQTDRFKTPWFENLYASIKDSKVGHTSLLSEKELEKRLLEPLPEGFTMLEVLEAIRYRQREYRKDIMPQVSNWEELTGLTLEDYRPALGKLLTPQSLKQTLSALTRHYIEFLKDTYSSDVKSGVHRLKDPWSIKVLHLKSEVIGQFNEWLEHLETGYHLSDASKIRGVARLIFERTSNPIRTRATRYSSFNPEIEDLLRLYQTTGTSNEDSKSVASAARKAIKLAGIQTADELKSTKGLEKIAFLNYSGEVSDGDKSRSKKFFWWLGQEFKFKVPPYFESNKIETIHQLTDDQNAWFQLNIAQVLDKSISKRKDYKQQLDLYRLIMAQLSTRDVHKFTDVLPSDFIAAAALASKHQRNLGILRGLKGISQALVTYSSQKNKWKYCSAETFDQFENRCLDSIEGCGDRNLEQLDLNRYKPVFNSLDGSWSAFFPLIMQDFRAAALADEKCREGKRSVKKSLATPEHYKLIYENLLTVGHGKPCGNRKTGAVQDLYGTYRTGGLLDKNPNTLSQDEKRSLEKYTAYALQAFGGLRFRSESDSLIYYDYAPLLNEDTESCIFPKTYKDKYLGEITCLALFQQGENRKVDLSYLVPLSTLCDEFLLMHLAAQNIKHGQKIFTLNVSTLADDIKRTSCKWFKANMSFEKLLEGETNKAFTTHRFRNILVRSIATYYDGSDSIEIQALVLGHTPDRTEGSSSTDIYTEYLDNCEKHFATLRRIKDQNYNTDSDLRNLRLEESIAKLKAENEQLHFKTHLGIDEILDKVAAQEKQKQLALEWISQNLSEALQATAKQIESSVKK